VPGSDTGFCGDHCCSGGEQQTLYVAASDHLYAVNASDGTVRWCQQVKLTREFRYHSGVSYPPPSRMTFGTPRMANGAVYVCASGYDRYIYAFNAGDGTLRWCTPTDGWNVSMPFGDFAVPVMKDDIVYNGTYALNEQDGQCSGASPSIHHGSRSKHS